MGNVRWDFRGKVALASGGGSGIGRAAVEAWVAAGARVAIFDQLVALPPYIDLVERITGSGNP